MLLLTGCEIAATDFHKLKYQNTHWQLETLEYLGEIRIIGDSKFCIDRPLAEKLYPKEVLESYVHTDLCGDFMHGFSGYDVWFNLRDYGKGVQVVHAAFTHEYYMHFNIDEKRVRLLPRERLD